MKVNTAHPTDTELNLLLDGELTPESAAAVNRHLGECSACRQRSESLRQVDQLIRQAALEPVECCSEGAFWVQLAGRLDEPGSQPEVPAPRPWARLLPSFGLAALGGLLDVLLTVVLVGYSLINLGWLPNLGGQLISFLQNTLPNSSLVALLVRLGILNQAALQAWFSSLTSNSLSGNELVLIILLVVLSLVLALVITLLLVWNMPRTNDDLEQRKVNVHAVR